MTYETVQVFSGSPITPEELLVLAEFAAPSHFVSDDHLRDAAENLADWTDHESVTITRALRLASRQDVPAQRRRVAAPRPPGRAAASSSRTRRRHVRAPGRHRRA